MVYEFGTSSQTDSNHRNSGVVQSLVLGATFQMNWNTIGLLMCTTKKKETNEIRTESNRETVNRKDSPGTSFATL